MITTCYKITVDQFCDCLFEKKYDILGEGTGNELIARWDKIFVEYCDLMNDANYNDAFHLLKDIQALNAKIQIIALCVDYLSLQRDEEIERILYEAGIKPHKDFEKLQKLAVARIKRLTAELQVMRQDLDKLMDKKTESGREQFEDTLLTLSKVRKVHLLTTEVTIYQFCKMVKEAEREYQSQQFNPR